VLEHSHARLTAITIGQHNEDAVEVRSGVSAGEQLIIHPPNELQPGDRVAVKR
jgi:HlyD family secretion protein